MRPAMTPPRHRHPAGQLIEQYVYDGFEHTEVVSLDVPTLAFGHPGLHAVRLDSLVSTSRLTEQACRSFPKPPKRRNPSAAVIASGSDAAVSRTRLLSGPTRPATGPGEAANGPPADLRSRELQTPQRRGKVLR